MKQKSKNIIEFLLFVMIMNIPFVMIVQSVGIDTFLDAYEHPDDYKFLQFIATNAMNSDVSHIMLQKDTHPDFSLDSGDTIIYYENQYGFQYGKIDLISTDCQQKIYYIYDDEQPQDIYQPVFEQQIVGKIISIMDTNIWHTIVFEFWDATLTRLNPLSISP